MDHPNSDHSDSDDFQVESEPELEIERDDSVFSFSGHEIDKKQTVEKDKENELDNDEEETACVYCLDINEAEKIVISGGHDDHLRVWSMDLNEHQSSSSTSRICGSESDNSHSETNFQLQTDSSSSKKQLYLVDFEDTVHQVGWSNNPSTKTAFFGADMAGNIKVFAKTKPENKPSSFEILFETSLGIDISWATWHPSASFLIVGCDSPGSVYMFPISMKADKNYLIPPRIFMADGFRSTSYCWFNDKTLITGYENGLIASFQLKDTKPAFQIKNPNPGSWEPVSMSKSNDGSLIAVGRTDGKVLVVLVTEEGTKMKVLHCLKVDDGSAEGDRDEDMEEEDFPQSVESVCFQPDSSKQLLACGCVRFGVELIIFDQKPNF